MCVVSRKWVWVESMDVVGVVVWRYIDFLILLIPTPLFFAYFLFILKMFLVLVQYFFVIYVKKIPRSINTHTGDYGCPTAAI